MLSSRNLLLAVFAAALFTSLALWIKNGMPLPGRAIPSTAGKIAFVSTRGGKPDLWMMGGADGSGAVALTSDDAEDRSPAWNPDGTELAFVSGGRAGATPQIFRMDPLPGAKAVQVSNTSTSKSAPSYPNKNVLNYLDTGKLLSYNVIENDTTARLPSADWRQLLAPYLELGGFRAVVPSPDGDRYLCTLQMEEAQALMLYVPGEQLLALLGFAEKVHASWKPDGGFVAVYVKGGPGQPTPLISAELLKRPDFTPPPISQLRPPTDATLVVAYDKDLNPLGEPTVGPFPPDSVAFSPDGTKLAFAFEREGEKMVGLFLIPLGGGTAIQQVYDKPATEPAFSPDGQNVAFVAANDIYVVPSGGGTPKNLTNGQGASSHPVWSPAVAK
jgi:hypothetical protein